MRTISCEHKESRTGCKERNRVCEFNKVVVLAKREGKQTEARGRSPFSLRVKGDWLISKDGPLACESKAQRGGDREDSGGGRGERRGKKKKASENT